MDKVYQHIYHRKAHQISYHVFLPSRNIAYHTVIFSTFNANGRESKFTQSLCIIPVQYPYIRCPNIRGSQLDHACGVMWIIPGQGGVLPFLKRIFTSGLLHREQHLIHISDILARINWRIYLIQWLGITYRLVQWFRWYLLSFEWTAATIWQLGSFH